MTTLQEKLKRLPAGRRKRIDERTAQLVAEELTMRELRKARNITQARLAQVLNVKQEQVSRIEKRTDLHISTLRRQIEALGGSLTILATFPNGLPIKIAGLGEPEAHENSSEVVLATLRIFEGEGQRFEPKLAALRDAVDRGDASGLAKGKAFERVRQQVKVPTRKR